MSEAAVCMACDKPLVIEDTSGIDRDPSTGELIVICDSCADEADRA